MSEPIEDKEPAEDVEIEQEGAEEEVDQGPDFDGLFKELEGTTVTVQPRVSRESIIKVLRENTGLIKFLMTDFTNLRESFKELQSQTEKNTDALGSLNNEFSEQKKTITEIIGRCDTFRTELDGIQNTLTDVYALKQQMREQKFALEDLTAKFRTHTSEIDEYLKATDTKLAGMDVLNKETQFKLTELKEYVDHFGDNLILSSSQITVESNIGFSKRPMALRDVLKTVNKFQNDMGSTMEDHEKRIVDNTEVVATKADATVILDVQGINQRVTTIEVHLKKEEETGISAIRKACDDLTVSVESIITDLAEKVDTRSVDNIVHKKYEDIVEYLQQALASNAEDENNFNAKAAQMELDMRRIAAGKADRVEIQQMQESIVKNEAMMQKFTNQLRPSEMAKIKDMLSRDDIDRMLAVKMDRTEFEDQLKEITKNLRKKARTINMGGGDDVSSVLSRHSGHEEAMHSRMAEHMGGGGGSGMVGGEASLPGDPQSTLPPISSVHTGGGPEEMDDNVFDRNSPKLNPAQQQQQQQQRQQQQRYPTVPPNFKASAGQDLSVLGASTKGGGFNQHNKGATGAKNAQGKLEELQGMAPNDVEGLGLMTEGTDGHMYYSDVVDDPRENNNGIKLSAV